MQNLASLWISLSLHRAFIITTYGQDPFNHLSDVFKTNISLEEILDNNEFKEDSLLKSNKSNSQSNRNSLTEEELVDDELIKYIRKNKNNLMMNTNNLYSMLNILYNFMTFSILKLTQASNKSHGDVDDNAKSQEQLAEDNLKIYLTQLVDNEIKTNDKFEMDYFNIEMFQIKHVYHVWRLFTKLYDNQRN